MKIKKSIYLILVIFLISFIYIRTVKSDVYYGTFNHATLLESNGLIRKWEVNNYTLIYDDDESFWSLSNYGSGSFNWSSIEETIVKTNGYSSLKIFKEAGSKAGFVLDHNYDTAEDFSDTNYFSVDVYGNNSGNVIFVRLASTPTFTSYYTYQIVDNFTGWNRILIHHDNFTISNSPSWNNIYVIRLFDINNLDKLYYLDFFVRMNDLDLNTYYEIWDGSTLKYQSTIEPDINDFILSQIDESNYNGLYLLQITTIALSIVFWLPFDVRPAVKILSGLLSIMGWFIAALLTVIAFTDGWMWAMFYGAVGVVSMLLLVNVLLDNWNKAGRRI